MCAYNKVNGVPSCADFNLLSNTARAQWGFHGYITSDCDAVALIHHKSPEDAVVDVLKAGMDVNCGSYLQNHTKSAVDQKKLPESTIDRALHNLFSVRMRLGLFNGNPKKLPFGNIGPNQVCSQEHQILALEAARNSIVLLKNSGSLLPLAKSKTNSLAIIGPHANSARTLLGNYAGPPCKSVTPLQALKNYVKNPVYHPGCDSVQCPSASIEKAIGIAKGADHVVLMMGLDQTQETEGQDRVDLVLPGFQQELIEKISKSVKNPIVLVLFCGGPVDVSFAKDDKNIGSIIWAGYPGESGGVALAEIIFGDHNPGGRLPMTWYPQEFVKVPMTDMRMRPDLASGYPGRTYRFYKGRKVFEFGYGLSYSKYAYKIKSVSRNKLYLNNSSKFNVIENSESIKGISVFELGGNFCEESKFSVRVGVENRGGMAGKHPILLFARHGDERREKRLVGFESVILKAGENAEIEFELSPCEHFTRATDEGVMVLEEGTHYLVVEGDQYPISIIV